MCLWADEREPEWEEGEWWRAAEGEGLCCWRQGDARDRCGEAEARGFWEDTLGEGDFRLLRGDTSLEGEETLPERSSEVTDLLAL